MRTKKNSCHFLRNMNPTVSPLDQAKISNRDYHVAIGVIGYESRARFFFETHSVRASVKLAFQFSDHQTLDFSSNLKFFTSAGFVPISPEQAGLDSLSAKIVELSASSKESISVIFDVSSLTRKLMSSVFFLLRKVSLQLFRSIDLTIVYSLAKFGSLPPDFGPVVFNGPAIPELCGWPKEPTQELGLVIGIGYERDLALGVIEELEPAALWMFRPRNLDKNYDAEIEEKNRGLFDNSVGAQASLYPIEDPYASFVAVDTLLSKCHTKYRTIILPLGPKIFAAAACLSALRLYPHIGYWRVSGGKNVEPVDRAPSGRILGLCADFNPK